ncbi:MAG TPA: glycogen synthase GlgA, partial [Anaerovoracaceae bacterium]|nr:glycogen synthase GlgA [Anaerovoracaceae bacterium]
MNILFISTEAVPFAKTGGLGDVIGSLPSELLKKNINVAVMLPLYKSIKEEYAPSLIFHRAFTVDLGWRDCYCGVFSMEYNEVTFYFIDNEQYFHREGFYGHYDDGERFAYFGKAALESLQYIDYEPDILHCSEWQSALVPVFLKTHYAENAYYRRLKTVFTIHNIEYQGVYGSEILHDILGLGDEYADLLMMDDKVNYMKGAIVTCDRLTTVSPSYAEEITYSFFAHGLHSIINENRYKLSGIINGIDYKFYNPYRDKALPFKYSKNSPDKKYLNKAALKEELGLDTDPDVPIIGMIGRLVEHKGIPLITTIFDQIMDNSVQFVMLGTGDYQFESFFKDKADQYRGRMAAVTEFSTQLASRIYAGSDLFLMPSISEPCGLAQMIALRYGTIPIVRATGGLKDSINPYNPKTGIGNGIRFDSINAHDMLDAVQRALRLYHQPEQWSKLMNNAFNTDSSWKRSAAEYIK